MDKIEYTMMSAESRSELASQRLSLATLGDAERLAGAYSACPWLIDADHSIARRGLPRPSILSHLASHAGSDACRRFGSLIVPHPDDPKSFQVLVEAMVLLEAGNIFQQKTFFLTGSRFFQILQGMDANPHLPPNFGSQTYGRLLSPHSPYMIDGVRSPADAAWWTRACKTADHAQGLRREDIELLHAMQASETFALLVEVMRRSPEASLDEAEAMGRSFGDSMALLTQNWPVDKNKQTRCSNALYERHNASSWRANLPNAARDADLPTTQLAIDAALSRLDEPILQALAIGASAGFARAIETNLLLKSTPGGMVRRPAPRRM